MKTSQILLLLAIVAGVSAGQVLLKYGANALEREDGLWNWVFNPFLIAGTAVYCACALAWVLILRDLALSKAYPFFSLSFALVPLLGWLFFSEPTGRLYAVGLLCICIGVSLVSR